MDRLLGQVVSRALHRGMRGEPLWLAVGVGVWVWRRARHPAPRTVWSGRVRPGQQLLVTVPDLRSKSMTEQA